MATRRSVVDDADPRVEYLGSGWFTASGEDGMGNQGPTYLGSQHGLKGSGSLSFTFEGQSIELYGTNGQIPFGGAYGPRWQCFVDGQPISSRSGLNDAQNNWPLCAVDGLGQGTHRLEVQITGSSKGMFWFDRLMYTLPGGGTEGEVAWIDATDPAFTYDNNWSSVGVMRTAVNGAVASFGFVGSSLTWVGEIPGNGSPSPASFNYTIDGSRPISIQMEARASNDPTTHSNHIFFSTPIFSSGSHTISVTYKGDQDTPLTVGYVYVFGTAARSVSKLWPFELDSVPQSSISSPSASSAHSLSSSLFSFNSTTTVVQRLEPTGSISGSPQPWISTSTVSSFYTETSLVYTSPSQGTAGVSAKHPVEPWAIAVAVLGSLFLLILLAFCLYRRRRCRPRAWLLPTPSPIATLNPFVELSRDLATRNTIAATEGLGPQNFTESLAADPTRSLESMLLVGDQGKSRFVYSDAPSSASSIGFDMSELPPSYTR